MSEPSKSGVRRLADGGDPRGEMDIKPHSGDPVREAINRSEFQDVMAAEQPPYPECPDCGELVRTIEHERMAAIGQCSRAGNGGERDGE